MSKVESPQDVFARVIDGAVVEYPVSRLHITNRSHPIEWYTPVVDVNKPEVPAFHYVTSKLDVGDGLVYATYEVVPYSLSQLLARINSKSMDRPGPANVMISEVEPELVQRILQMTSDYAEQKLEEFVATRGYYSLNNLLSRYTGSTIPKFAAEANRAQVLLDGLWARLTTYYTEIAEGARSVPSNINEIDEIIGEFTWGDAV